VAPALNLSLKKMVAYKVSIAIGEDQVRTFDCNDDQYIIDAAEDNGIEINYACKSGMCSSCLCRLKSGSVDQESQLYLDNDEVMEGMFLSCVAYPTSDVEMTADIPPAIR